jgi:integrase
MTLAYTGLRWGELAARRVEDVDSERRCLNVNQAVTEVGRNLIYGTRKNHGRRSVPFLKFVENALRDRTANRLRSDFVFTANDPHVDSDTSAGRSRSA